MIAASVTVRVIGPAVSWSPVIGITPQRLIRPTVGLIPASMLAFEGDRIEPDVSVPTLPAQKLAAVPMPELDPPVLSTGRRRAPPWDRAADRTGSGRSRRPRCSSRAFRSP